MRGTQEVGGSIPPGSTNIKDCLLPPRPVDVKIRQDKNFVFVMFNKLGRVYRESLFIYKNLSKRVSIKSFCPHRLEA